MYKLNIFISFSTYLHFYIAIFCTLNCFVDADYLVKSYLADNFYPLEKRLGGRKFQLIESNVNSNEFNDNKRGGARNFDKGKRIPFFFEEKKGGARNFKLLNNKRGGGRTFALVDSNEKRNDEPIFNLVNKRNYNYEKNFEDKRGGAHFFQKVNKKDDMQKFLYDNLNDQYAVFVPNSKNLILTQKKAGARPFFGNLDSKRGGGRYFSPYASFKFSRVGNIFDKRGKDYDSNLIPITFYNSALSP